MTFQYDSTFQAWRTWLLARGALGLSGAQSTNVREVDGLYLEQEGKGILVFQKGPYLIFLGGPSAGTMNRLVALGDQFSDLRQRIDFVYTALDSSVESFQVRDSGTESITQLLIDVANGKQAAVDACYLLSTANCAALLRIICDANVPIIRCSQQPSFTKPTCAWLIKIS